MPPRKPPSPQEALDVLSRTGYPLGVTGEGLDELDTQHVCTIAAFMGGSTRNRENLLEVKLLIDTRHELVAWPLTKMKGQRVVLRVEAPERTAAKAQRSMMSPEQKREEARVRRLERQAEREKAAS